VTKTGSAIYDASGGVVRLTTMFDAGMPGEPATRWVRSDRLRLVGPDELAAFAGSAGLEIEAMAGDWELGPLEAGADRVVLVARKPDS
jgi:hypothetical protein